jgi:hypothetical protein
VFELDSFGRWVHPDAFAENDKVRVAPFEQTEIDLDHPWLEKTT